MTLVHVQPIPVALAANGCSDQSHETLRSDTFEHGADHVGHHVPEQFFRNKQVKRDVMLRASIVSGSPFFGVGDPEIAADYIGPVSPRYKDLGRIAPVHNSNLVFFCHSTLPAAPETVGTCGLPTWEQGDPAQASNHRAHVEKSARHEGRA